MPYLISVIVSTYNWPNALDACLKSLLDQHDNNFEIIIADDGSNLFTQQLIETYTSLNEPAIRHIYHEDLGFRAGTIRNKAVAASRGDYLIFLDGDCIVLPHFLTRHRKLAETNYFVPGNRILLNNNLTQELFNQSISVHRQPIQFFILNWLKKRINRITPFLYIPLQFQRYWQPTKWNKAMTCNLAVWKNNFIAVNGFDELFEGWGFEDSDLVIRLIHQGIKRKEGRFAVPVLHLWHKQNDRSRHDKNYARLLERINNPKIIRAEKGVDQYFSD